METVLVPAAPLAIPPAEARHDGGIRLSGA